MAESKRKAREKRAVGADPLAGLDNVRLAGLLGAREGRAKAEPAPAQPEPEAVERLVRDRQPRCLSYEDWRRLDDLETARGRACARPRIKFTRVDEMLAALGRTPAEPRDP